MSQIEEGKHSSSNFSAETFHNTLIKQKKVDRAVVTSKKSEAEQDSKRAKNLRREAIQFRNKLNSFATERKCKFLASYMKEDGQSSIVLATVIVGFDQFQLKFLADPILDINRFKIHQSKYSGESSRPNKIRSKRAYLMEYFLNNGINFQEIERAMDSEINARIAKHQ